MWIFFVFWGLRLQCVTARIMGPIFSFSTERKFFIAYIAAILFLCFVGGALRHKDQIAWFWPGQTVARPVEKRVIHFPGQAAFDVYVPAGEDYNGEVPLDEKALMGLAGVGQKPHTW